MPRATSKSHASVIGFLLVKLLLSSNHQLPSLVYLTSTICLACHSSSVLATTLPTPKQNFRLVLSTLVQSVLKLQLVRQVPKSRKPEGLHLSLPEDDMHFPKSLVLMSILLSSALVSNRSQLRPVPANNSEANVDRVTCRCVLLIVCTMWQGALPNLSRSSECIRSAAMPRMDKPSLFSSLKC